MKLLILGVEDGDDILDSKQGKISQVKSRSEGIHLQLRNNSLIRAVNVLSFGVYVGDELLYGCGTVGNILPGGVAPVTDYPKNNKTVRHVHNIKGDPTTEPLSSRINLSHKTISKRLKKKERKLVIKLFEKSLAEDPNIKFHFVEL